MACFASVVKLPEKLVEFHKIYEQDKNPDFGPNAHVVGVLIPKASTDVVGLKDGKRSKGRKDCEVEGGVGEKMTISTAFDLLNMAAP